MIRYQVGLLLVVAGIGLSVAVPQWPDCYKVSGVIRYPYAEINEPFTGYFEGKKKKSRVDYYGDLVQTYQIGDGTNGFGRNYKVVPVTTEEVVNVKTCYFEYDFTCIPQDLVPDMTGFELIGYKLIDARNCSLWQNVTKYYQKKNVYNMFLSVDKNEPVRYEMIGYDTLFGSFYDKYYIDYTVFTALPSLPDNIFKPPENLTCVMFPDVDSHCLSMNPIREYIHPHDSSCHVDGLFQSFKEKHGKDYADENEHVKRKHIFHNNLRFIHSKNRAALGYTLAVNHMADFTEEEMRMVRGRLPATGNNGGIPFDKSKYIGKPLPDYVDWRLSGAVTPVKDQAICGSCWSFAATGTVEGAHFLKTGELVRLSQQELVDCSWGEGNDGCNGGYSSGAYNWIMKHGLASEEAYGPYLAQDGLCHSKDVKPTASVKSYVNVTSGDIEALRMAVANIGPIAVAIDSNHRSFHFYSNGVYYEPHCRSKLDELNHEVLAVGYGVFKGEAFWLIKNSWSTYWGNDGYILMSQKDNNCGVATHPTYVVM